MNSYIQRSKLRLLLGGFALCTTAILFGQSFPTDLSKTLQKQIDSLRTNYNYRGISACMYSPIHGTWQGVSGFSHAGTPISNGMAFGIASNTKLFTAVMVLKLVENHRLKLDDSLHQYLPSFKNIDTNITIRQLLNHTTGLDDVTNVPGYPDSMMQDPNRVFTATELMGWTGKPLFTPGQGWNYCNTNYLLAGLIVEKVSGNSFSKILRDSILTPLLLDSTFLAVYETKNLPIAHPWQAGTDNNSAPRTSINSAAWTAGAMYSNASEMVQWYRALMAGKILNPASMKELTTFVGSGNYGMGIAQADINGRTVWYHGGQIWGGYNSSIMYDTATGVIACVLINQLPAQAFLVTSSLIGSVVSNPLTVEPMETPASISLNPNPCRDILQISASGRPIRCIYITDMQGKKLIDSSESNISVSSLSEGMYQVHIRTASGTSTLLLAKKN